ncbi:MAG: hypothetical protein ACRCX2_12795 [Paraclostridium sp.]
MKNVWKLNAVLVVLTFVLTVVALGTGYKSLQEGMPVDSYISRIESTHGVLDGYRAIKSLRVSGDYIGIPIESQERIYAKVNVVLDDVLRAQAKDHNGSKTGAYDESAYQIQLFLDMLSESMCQD